RQALTACVRRRPDFAWLYVLRGHAAGQEGDVQAAREDFRTAGRLEADDLARYTLRVNRSVLALQRKQAAEALADLQEAVRLQPRLYHAHLNLAHACEMQGRVDRAVEHLDRAIGLARRADLYRTRARLHQRRQDPAGALRDLGEAARLEASAAAR